jgi:hypothetical protein
MANLSSKEKKAFDDYHEKLRIAFSAYNKTMVYAAAELDNHPNDEYHKEKYSIRLKEASRIVNSLIHDAKNELIFSTRQDNS